MKQLYRIFLSLIFLQWCSVLLPGFAGKTLVKTPYGYVPIAWLDVGDEVYGVSKDGVVEPTIVVSKVCYQRKKYLQILVQDQELIVAQGQKFLLPLKHVWCKAKNLHEDVAVRNAWQESLQVHVVKTGYDSITFYDICLQKDHAFIVTEADIVVHNMPYFCIGILITFEGLKFTIETVWVGMYLFGLWLGSKLLVQEKKITAITPFCAGIDPVLGQVPGQANDVDMRWSEQDNCMGIYMHDDAPSSDMLLQSENVASAEELKNKNKKKKPSSNKKNKNTNTPSGGSGPDDKDPKKPNRIIGPFGSYKESPKHHENSPPTIGKPPPDGQAALDNSIGVKGYDYRVAVQDGKIVMLRKTSTGEYHGYIVEDFNSLPQEAKNALYEHGLIRSIQSGKIKK